MNASTPGDGWSSQGLREQLQLIADDVSDVAGFEIAAISVLRPDERFEYVAVSSGDESVQAMLGRGNPLSVIEEQNRSAVPMGRFDFVPHDRFDDWTGVATWRPEVEYADAPDAWHPDDMLGTLLRDLDQRIIGMLSLDVPVNGRIPGPDQIKLIDAFALHTERVLARGLDRVAIKERLRLANTARTIVRSATTTLSLTEVLAQSRPALVEGFGLSGLWVQTFGDNGVAQVTTASGKAISAPEDLLMLAERAARTAWAQQSVAVVGPSTEPVWTTKDEQARVLEFVQSIGAGSILFVPMGSSEICLGNLVLTRADPDAPWTADELLTAGDIGRDLGQLLRNAQLFESNRALLAELRDLNDYKRTLVDMMVHEFKNPLTAISGHVEMALMMDPPPLLERSLEAIDRGATRMSGLVNSLLTLSRVNERIGTESFTDVSVNELVSRTVELLQVSADAASISVTASVQPLITVHGNAELLELVVSNLISNAIKYTPDGGKVTVVAHTEHDELVLRVTDTGLGISEEDQARLFHEFFRSSNPEAKSRPGTGLGLTIVSRVVEQHGGRVSLESALGKGSAFEVRLPLAEVARQ